MGGVDPDAADPAEVSGQGGAQFGAAARIAVAEDLDRGLQDGAAQCAGPVLAGKADRSGRPGLRSCRAAGAWPAAGPSGALGGPVAGTVRVLTASRRSEA
ncbi:hypothetical protein GCM10010519_34840 [Streptomyces lactacystinicus]